MSSFAAADSSNVSLRQQWNVRLVRVLKIADDTSSYVAYVVQTKISGRDKPLAETQHRYSEFRTLWSNLQSQGLTSLPELPPKKLFNMGKDVIKERRIKLEACMNALLQIPGAQEWPDLLTFLDIQEYQLQNDDEQSAATTSVNESVPTESKTSSTAAHQLPVNQLLQRLDRTDPARGLQLVGMIRHSARLDEIDGAIWNDKQSRGYDTPIRDFDLPLNQAKQLQKFEFTAVVSSPFRRCVQTAAIIAQAFGHNVLHVDNRLGEVMHKIRQHTTSDEGFTYMDRNEMQLIASGCNLVISWNEEVNKPPINESTEQFFGRCNQLQEIARDSQAALPGPAELQVLQEEIVSLQHELAAAREQVARAAEDLKNAFRSFGLTVEQVDSKLGEIADLPDPESYEGKPVENRYRDALIFVKEKQSMLEKKMRTHNSFVKIGANEPLAHPWQRVLYVTHADLICQRLQHIKPNAIYAPDVCGWFVEHFAETEIVTTERLQQIM